MAESIADKGVARGFGSVWPGFSKYAVITAVVAIVVLFWLQSYAPFYAPSYLFWAGVLLVLSGVISLIKPLRFLMIANRKIGVAVLFFGLGLSACGLLWPVPLIHTIGPRQRIDDFLPEYSFREYHETIVQAAPQRVLSAVQQVCLADVPIARWLLRLRALAGRGSGPRVELAKPILAMLNKADSGFLTLDPSAPHEYVGAMVGQPWTAVPPPPVTTAQQFLSFHAPGHIKVVFNFLVKDLGQGQTLLGTETRIQGNDQRARRIFGCYWRIIYPGSAIIRRVWLEAIAARAEGFSK